jgi:hypothetical protein
MAPYPPKKKRFLNVPIPINASKPVDFYCIIDHHYAIFSIFSTRECMPDKNKETAPEDD